MLYLEDKREVRLFEITGTEGTEVEQTLKSILEEYDDVVSQYRKLSNYRIYH